MSDAHRLQFHYVPKMSGSGVCCDKYLGRLARHVAYAHPERMNPGWGARCTCGGWTWLEKGVKPMKLIEHEHFMHTQDAARVALG